MRSHPSYRTKVATSVCVPWCQGGAKRRKMRKLVRYYYLVPTVANPWFSFSYPDVFLTGFVKRKTPQSLEITAFLVRLSGFEPLAFRLGDMFAELPAMSSHIPLCISTMLRLLSISSVVQYSQLSEPIITKVIVSKKLAAIFQTAN